ncbi:MAG TPA: PadR family transcriptional regulator [Rugosimonospora sp.]|nr:PadR family transcriptional regulator [Rugosimonospora sp.]
MQDVLLAMLATEPSHGYDLRERLRRALGPLGEGRNGGQVYVTLVRLAKAGLVTWERTDGLPARPDRKVYALTPAGRQRVAAWLAEVGWPKPDLTEFHLKLVVAAAHRLADPLDLVDAQRRELLRHLAEVRRAAPGTGGSPAGLLLAGVVLRLRADLRWLEACEQAWSARRRRGRGYRMRDSPVGMPAPRGPRGI